MSEINPQEAWERARSSAYLFADIVMESDEGQGLPQLADMDIGQIERVVSALMRDGQQEPEIMRHTVESLLVLLKDSEQRSSRDALTQIHNRAHLEEMVDLHLERMQRGKATQGALVLMDLDGFKPINDIYGHAAGDAALVKAARTLSESVRGVDVAARIGGDEFAVLLMDADEGQAQEMTQRLRAVFSTLSFEWEGRALPIRASVGVAQIDAGQDKETVFKQADQAMYAEKNSKPVRNGAGYTAAAYAAPFVK